MMFRKLYTIKGEINKGFLIESNIIVLQSKTYLKKLDISNGEIIIETENLGNLNFQKMERISNGYVGLANGKVSFLSDNLNEIETKKIRYTGYNLYEKEYLVHVLDYDYNTFKGKCGFYELSTGNVIWEADTGENIKVESGVAFTVSSENLCCRDILNGSKKWNYKIDNKNLVPEVIGIFETTVIFGLQEKDKILAIDVETGAITWEIDTFVKGLLMDKEKVLLHQMLGNYGAHDLKTGKLVANFNDDAYFESVGIESQRSNYVLVGDHIITTDWQKGIIGAFNTVTHKFDWVHKEEGVNFPSPNPILYNEPYLLAHDNKGTLHIFEKET